MAIKSRRNRAQTHAPVNVHVTKREAARILGTSYHNVRYHTLAGRLAKDEHGVLLESVLAFKAKRELEPA